VVRAWSQRRLFEGVLRPSRGAQAHDPKQANEPLYRVFLLKEELRLLLYHLIALVYPWCSGIMIPLPSDDIHHPTDRSASQTSVSLTMAVPHVPGTRHEASVPQFRGLVQRSISRLHL
jgi:hypothetical protein